MPAPLDILLLLPLDAGGLIAVGIMMALYNNINITLEIGGPLQRSHLPICCLRRLDRARTKILGALPIVC